MDVWVCFDSPCIHRCVHMYMCVPLTAPIITVWPRLYVLPTSCQRLSALYIGFSTLCRTRQLLSCSTVEVQPECCLQVGTSVLVRAGVAVSGLGWSCCWLVYLQFTSQRLAIVCLEREESMRKSWMQVLDAGSALYV